MKKNKNKKSYIFVALAVMIVALVVTGAVIWGQGEYFSGMLRPNGTVKPYASQNSSKSINKMQYAPLVTNEQTQIKNNLEKANIAVLEIASNDPSRAGTGNVNMEAVVEKFYKNHPDNYDFMITIGFKDDYATQLFNGWSNGNIHLEGPLNIGKKNSCDTVNNPNCEGFPTKLKYMQQISYKSERTLEDIGKDGLHEILHYWGNGWHTPNADDCFEPWVSQMLENGHWTQLFSAGPVGSAHTYPVNFLESRQNPPTAELLNVPQYGTWTDNKDGTFTFQTSNYENQGFNYVDLYQMGLLRAEELSQKEMFVVLNPILIEQIPRQVGTQTYFDWVYSGTRRDITFNELKNLLLEKEQCENTGPNYYYFGDGNRIPGSLPELARDFKVAFALIKYPDQKITQEDAQRLCKLVNNNIPDQWYRASRTNIGANSTRSVMHTNLSDSTQNPDCESLFPTLNRSIINLDRTTLSPSEIIK